MKYLMITLTLVIALLITPQEIMDLSGIDFPRYGWMAHISVFVVLSVMALWITKLSKSVMVTVLFGAAVLMELMQAISNRQPSIEDVLMNCLGVVVGCGIYLLLRRPTK